MHLRLTAQAVADLVGGRLVGSGEVIVEGVAPLDDAGAAHLSYLSGASYLPAFRKSSASVVLIPPGFESTTGGPPTRIVVDDPRRAFVDLLAHFHTEPEPPPAGVDPTARLGAEVIMGEGVSVGPFAVLATRVRLGNRVRIGPGVVLESDVEVGDDSTLRPRVVCCSGTRLGARVIVQAGTVIGERGFGYISGGTGGHHSIPHIGGCRIEDDVEIGSNVCIDRGTLGDTVIGKGTKIDNLVHIAHNVQIGEHCLIMGSVAIAGSAKVGDWVTLAGQVGVRDHVSVGDRVRAAAQTGIAGDIAPGQDISGFPARPNRDFLRSQAVLHRLVPLARRLEDLARETDPNG